MIRVFTDFDGPIMNVSDRYYRVYQFCLKEIQRPNQPILPMSKAEFWQCKRGRVPEIIIGIRSGLDPSQAEAFAQLRRQTVHTLPYLVHDQPVPGAIDALEKLQEAGVDLAVMTMRRVRELDEAFSRLDLEKFFPPNRRYCLSNDYVKTGDTKDKPLLMAKALKELPAGSDVWMIGDTEADIVAAKTHGIKAIGVLSGIRDRAQLNLHEPDFMVNNLAEAVDLVLDTAVLQAV